MTGIRLLPVAVGMFAVGLLAVVAVFVLYTTGYGELPLWLNLMTLLAPLGFVLAVVRTVLTRN